MLLQELHMKQKKILSLASEFGARRIRVFGSVARGEERPDSDIDFLVDFPQGYDLFTQRLPLSEQLMKLTGRRVDLAPEHELNRHLRDAILKEAKTL
jgi:predicted nucleotidyltransferase